ncbi:MAG: hypothetical protein H6819_02230 [Phycisphaerales bacterium]|nr:hypothetical protein [Phycisphaerales bacterium]MCB9856970.1 hypothetical protein [Phycisphaerales bacterium]MCB9861903.1 hypothetical protein [Phycisphaerales bacterium]
MEQIVSVIDNALLQGLGYGIAVVGITIAFRVLRYPDLTADGSFLIGAAAFSATVTAGASWIVATVASVGGGATAGLLTALMHTKAGVNRLLSGILTAMMCYSVAFWILSGRSNLNLADTPNMYSAAELLDARAAWAELNIHVASVLLSAIVAAVAVLAVYLLLKSEFGVVLRATGENEALVEGLGRRPQRYHTAGLVLANGLVGLAGCLVSARQGFADVNMGFGVIITLVAALVIGEELARLMGLDPSRSLFGRAISGVFGACGYFFFYLFILRASILGWVPVRIQPTDLKLMSAIIVVVFVLVRKHANRRGNMIEEILPI